jgi:hypothetical protein
MVSDHRVQQVSQSSCTFYQTAIDQLFQRFCRGLCSGPGRFLRETARFGREDSKRLQCLTRLFTQGLLRYADLRGK